jgi:oxygen-independent coproporphyrinogen-3 oxidase
MEIDKSLIDKYNVPVPRYTSYPPANHFEQTFADEDYFRLIAESNDCNPENIAIYIHIPFCKKICFYCGCNTALYKGESLVADYIAALKKEIRLVSKHIDKRRKVSQIHYGGGTPNAIDVAYLEQINQLLFDLFDFIPKPEIAIECHPGHLNELYLRRLLNAGFNRFSLGIQDFDNEVLAIVNRDPSAMPVAEIINILKQDQPDVSVNFDFIYGLPGQTVERFRQTIEKAVSLRPDRLVTFSYAHVPWIKKHQQILEKKGLKTSTEKMDLFLNSREILLQAGYEPIGLDHYVLPEDELSQALQNKNLHRNFQGYCTRRTTGQVYAFGVSSISQFENAYLQNEKDTNEYIRLINEGKTAVRNGLQINSEQKIIRAVIEKIMCNKELNLNTFFCEQAINMSEFQQITQFESEKLTDLISDRLIHFNKNILTITEAGSFFIRNIAAIFDPAFIQIGKQYSKSV